MRLAGANSQPRVVGLDELSGRSNYFLGDDPRRWRTNVANYARVEYDEVYPGIDLVWHGAQRRLEHDFIVAPGADPRRIKLSFAGAQTVRVDEHGELVLQTAAGEMRLLKPQAWQEVNGERRAVACEYAINAKRQVSFRIGAYDESRELVIDPVLLYSTYLGGSGAEQGAGIALDKDGNIYVIGAAFNSDFPGPSPIQAAARQGAEVFVVKLNPSGSTILYGTWLGGANDDIPTGIAVDQDGAAYVTGQTGSRDFPVTNGSLQPQNGGLLDAFVTKINPAGSALVYSSYLGGSGSEAGTGIVVDGGGGVYLAGVTDSFDLPATGFQGDRASSGAFKTGDRASNWNSIGAALGTTQVRVISVDPRDSNTLYAGALSGLFKSADGGNQWRATGLGNFNGLPGSVQAIAVDPTNSNVIYVGLQFGAVAKSANGGDSFELKGNGLFNSGAAINVLDILIDPSAPATLYAGTDGGAFKSVNGGDLWTPINTGLTSQFTQTRVNRLAFNPANRAIIYAATNRGVFRTDNGGGLWTAINNGIGTPGAQVEILALAVDPTTPTTLYAGLAGFNGGLYKTTDSGATWRTSNTGLFLPGQTTPLTISSLVIDPSMPMTLYAGAGTAGVYKTTDGGATWNVANNGLPNTTVSGLAIDGRAPTNVYAAVAGGSDAFAAKINPAGAALDWLTYLGGAANDDARGIALDAAGNVYLAGATSSLNFPTLNPLQASSAGGSDAYVTKFDPSGSALIYSTYFGGGGGDAVRGLAVNSAGQAYIVGTTSSPNLPTRNSALTSLGGGNDAFVTKFSVAGTALEYSTYLGGSGVDTGLGIFVDGAGSAYVTGDTRSTNFPQLDPAQAQFGGAADAFVAKFSPAGAPLIYSTFIGGNGAERGTGLVGAANGDVYVVGDTSSANFPTSSPLQPALRGGQDAFIVKLGIEADLAIAKTASRNPALVNNNFSFTLTVTNNGPSAATGVTVTDQLPAGTTFVSAASSQGSCANNAGAVTCGIGNLAVRGKASITLTVTPTSAGVITNTASVAGNEREVNQANNQASAQVTISNQPSIYGRVRLANNDTLPGVTLNLTGAQTASQQVNDQGFYQFANLQTGGDYAVTPSLNNYSFEPPSRSFNQLNADQSADFVATQCSYALTPTNQTFEAGGGGGMITVTATPRCPWTAVASASWIKITSAASGSGNGSVTFTVDPAQAPRAGRITIGGQSFLIWQGVNVCNELRFRPRGYYGVGFPNDLFAADVDGDGLTDLFVMQEEVEFDPAQQRFAFPLTIYYGEANGRLTPGPRVFAASVTRPRSIAVGDFNGDGRRDLAVAPGNEPDALLLLSDGPRSFAPSGTVRLSPANEFGSPDRLRAADLNKDGKLDLIGGSSSKVLIALNTSTGANVSFAPAYAVSFEGQNFRGLADFNNDGVIDLLTAGSFAGGPRLLVYLGDGLGSFQQPVSSQITDFPLEADFADFNADGFPDVVMLAQTQTPQGNRLQVAVIYGDGAGHFGQLATYEPLLINNLIGQSPKLIARDVNNDARPDALVLGERKVRAVLTDPTGKPGAVVEVGSTDNFDLSAFAAGYFDGSGRLDFATIDGQRNSVVVHWNRCGGAGLTIFGQALDRDTPAGFGGVTVKLTGARTETVMTDVGGNYEFTGLAPGDYTVAVEGGATEFNPSSQTLNNLTTDQMVNFSGRRIGVTVSSASFLGQAIAPDSIASIFGLGMSRVTEVATEQPLPIRLANQYVYFTDSSGSERTAQLFFVSPNQINFLIPAEIPTGPAKIHVFSPVNSREPDTTGSLMIERVAPGLFAANAGGAGVAAALVLRVKADGTQSYEQVARFDGAKFISTPIDLGPETDQVFLLLFGTGIRNHSGLSNVTTLIGDTPCQVFFAGAQGGFEGLDQVNVSLSRGLAGRGEMDLVLTADGKRSNVVRVNIK